MDNRYLEKRVRKYVIATLETPTTYLKSLTRGQYVFVDNIEIATKTPNKKMGLDVLMDYYRDYGREVEMVVVPLDISYEIIEENAFCEA